MMIIGVDYHPSFQTIAFLMEETGECGEINNGPMILALLEMIPSQSHGFMPSQPTRE
jgi:hypothetical protein